MGSDFHPKFYAKAGCCSASKAAGAQALIMGWHHECSDCHLENMLEKGLSQSNEIPGRRSRF
jgi:hypothetical protein